MGANGPSIRIGGMVAGARPSASQPEDKPETESKEADTPEMRSKRIS